MSWMKKAMSKIFTKQFLFGVCVGLIIGIIEIIQLVDKIETLQKDNIEILSECTAKKLIK